MNNPVSQSATPCECKRNRQFLNRPYAEAKVYSCKESDFWKSLNCPRVKRLDKMRKNIIPHNEEEFEGLKRNQPTFNLTNQFVPEGGTRWNGCFLFSYHDCKFARKVMDAHADELGVIFSFCEPDYDRYWFLVDTYATDLSDETAKKERIRVMRDLHRYFPRVTPYGQYFFVRAVPEEYIEIIEPDAMFGELPKEDTPETPAPEPAVEKTPVINETRSFKTMRLGDIIDQMFGGIFKNRPAGCFR